MIERKDGADIASADVGSAPEGSVTADSSDRDRAIGESASDEAGGPGSVGAAPGGASDVSAATWSGGPGGSARGDAAESVERELVLLFRRARNVSATVAGHVHPDLDPASYSLLLMVADAGQLRGMDVADRIGLDKSTVSRQIATLVELDLLERVPDPDDGRARLIQLSAVGQQRLAQLRSRRSEYLREVFASWPTSDLREFARLLGQLNNVV